MGFANYLMPLREGMRCMHECGIQPRAQRALAVLRGWTLATIDIISMYLTGHIKLSRVHRLSNQSMHECRTIQPVFCLSCQIAKKI